MNKFISFCILLILGITVYSNTKVKISFSGPQAMKCIKRNICSIKGSILSMHGDTASKNNRFRYAAFNIPIDKLANRKFCFKGELKTEKMQGKFEIAIRLIDASGKSIKYVRYITNYNQDWDSFSKTFIAPANTSKIQYYLIAKSMNNTSIASVRNLIVEEVIEQKSSIVYKSTLEKSKRISSACWIWYPERFYAARYATRYFRKIFNLGSSVETAQIWLRADDAAKVKVNGVLFDNKKRLKDGHQWNLCFKFDMKSALKTGKNIIDIDVYNGVSAAGLICRIYIMTTDGKEFNISTDNNLRVPSS